MNEYENYSMGNQEKKKITKNCFQHVQTYVV